MIFIVSDLHLGKQPSSDTDSLSELERCIHATDATEVIFLGDVFDAFIESDRHIPTIVREWGTLAGRLKDEGIRVRYLMGNHDRWHRRFVTGIIGETPARDHLLVQCNGGFVHLEHGDRGQNHRTLTRAARWLSDQSWVHRLYTTMLPFGGAQALAAAVSRRFASFEPNPRTVQALREHASRQLRSSEALGVVMGHCHQVGLFDLSAETGRHAWYANSGDWYENRSFVLVGSNEVQVCCWREGERVTLSTLSTNPAD